MRIFTKINRFVSSMGLNIGEEIDNFSLREFIGKQFLKILVFLIMIGLIFIIIIYSRKIAPNSSILDTQNVIGFNNLDYWILGISSSVLFLLVLGSFSKLIFFDYKDDFGIESYRSLRFIGFMLLIMVFLSAVYILLDTALSNIYFLTGPIDLVWYINNHFNLGLFGITNATDRFEYAHIRSLYFIGLYAFLLVCPFVLALEILSRAGRSKIFSRITSTPSDKDNSISNEDTKIHKDINHEVISEHDKKVSMKILRFLLLLFIPIIELNILLMIFSNQLSSTYLFLIVILALILAVWWIFHLSKVIKTSVRLTLWLSYTNFLLVFPIILIFYIVPIFLWTGWDLYTMVTTHSTANTILTELNTPLANVTLNASNFNFINNFSLIVQDFLFNSVATFRIAQIDFVIIMSVSAILIGFSEGYSLIGLAEAIKSSSTIIMNIYRASLIGMWFTMFWDYLLVIYHVLAFDIPIFGLPKITFPTFLGTLISYIDDFSQTIASLGIILLPIILLTIPIYFILSSAFNFFSVSLILQKSERARKDSNILFLLISSAFVFITTNILQSLTYIATGNISPFLPFNSATAQWLLPWASKILNDIEAVAFVIGLLFILIIVIITILALPYALITKKKKNTKQV